MKVNMLRGFFILCICLAVAFLLVIIARGREAQEQADKDKAAAAPPAPPVRPRPIQPDADDQPPDETQLYVWPLPEKGTQSVLILRVIDGETVEAGFVVPALFHLHGGQAADPKSPEGKAAAAALSKLLTGRLLPARMAGRDQYGRIDADFWLGKAEADNPGGWAVRWMIDQHLLTKP